jgi:signal transduction histidine kinase
LRRAVDAFSRAQLLMVGGHDDDYRNLFARTTWVMGAIAACAIVLSAAMLWLFSREISGRLAVVTDNVRRMAEGRELARPFEGKDEIAQLDRSFHEMAAALKQKERENELFVYSVSHDLRSPLVNLQGFGQELAADFHELQQLCKSESHDARRRALLLLEGNALESIQFIQTAVTRLSGIIDSLLRLSRAGRVDYCWQPVDVQAAVKRVVDSLHLTLSQKGAEIKIRKLPPCWGDPTAIEQVFANLIDNAVNYLDPARPGRIEVGCLDQVSSDGLRAYYVKDNGLGIPSNHLSKVFAAFQRLHTDVAPGEGIGLAIVHRVVERHGGREWVESTEGLGSTFFVALPIRG